MLKEQKRTEYPKFFVETAEIHSGENQAHRDGDLLPSGFTRRERIGIRSKIPDSGVRSENQKGFEEEQDQNTGRYEYSKDADQANDSIVPLRRAAQPGSPGLCVCFIIRVIA